MRAARMLHTLRAQGVPGLLLKFGNRRCATFALGVKPLGHGARRFMHQLGNGLRGGFDAGVVVCGVQLDGPQAGGAIGFVLRDGGGLGLNRNSRLHGCLDTIPLVGEQDAFKAFSGMTARQFFCQADGFHCIDGVTTCCHPLLLGVRVFREHCAVMAYSIQFRLNGKIGIGHQPQRQHRKGV